MPLSGSKKWYKSKGVLGGIVTVLALIAGLFGYSVGAEEQEAIVLALSGIGAGVGSLLAIYGRITAKDDIE